jgi:predicted transcriptional regulator
MDSDMSLPTFKDIKERADRCGLSLSKLCREADISETTMQRWRRGDTDPLRKMRAVDEVLRRMEREKL